MRCNSTSGSYTYLCACIASVLILYLVTNIISIYSAKGKMYGTGFIAKFTMPNSSTPVTVLVTNHHVIHNLNEALEATYQFSYMRSDSTDTPPPIEGKKLILENHHGFYTYKEQHVSSHSYSTIMCHRYDLIGTIFTAK